MTCNSDLLAETIIFFTHLLKHNKLTKKKLNKKGCFTALFLLKTGFFCVIL